MGECKYCHKDAGWFRTKHSACEEKHILGINEIKTIIKNCFELKEDFYLKDNRIQHIIQESYIDKKSFDNILCSSFDEAIESYLNDGIIDSAEEQTIARFIQYSGLSQMSLNANKSLEKFLQAKVLRDIISGNTPTPQITITGDFPFLLSKSERLVWLFRNITLYQQKIQREYVGRSRGISVRIMKGVYYRTGGFKGHPIETTIMQRIGCGSVCLTDKHIYFSSPEKSLKIPYSKILSIESYSNGIGLQKDGASDKPIFLEGINSWFTYNVVANYK